MIEERFKSVDERLTNILGLIEQYWQENLPEKNQNNEHVFVDLRLAEEVCDSNKNISKKLIFLF